jgi:lysophospholipase L1-like esterase
LNDRTSPLPGHIPTSNSPRIYSLAIRRSPWFANYRGLTTIFRPPFTVVSLVLVLGCGAAVGRDSDANQPARPEIRYTAIGDSAAAGIGSRTPCRPFSACENGTSYAAVLARKLGEGARVRFLNMGMPGAVLSPTVESLASKQGLFLPGNFVDDEMPSVPPDTTLVTVFGGANDVNALTEAIERGAAGSDVDGYVDEQVRAFGRDYGRLIDGVAERAPAASCPQMTAVKRVE